MSHLPPSRLAFLMASPDRLEEVAREELPDLLASLEGFKARVWLLLNSTPLPPKPEKPGKSKDRYLTVKEAAKIVGLSDKWFYDHKNLPFMRVIPPRSIRVSEIGLRRWMESNR